MTAQGRPPSISPGLAAGQSVGGAEVRPDVWPDFFLIGAPKCGTTSLFSWLQQHPDTFLPVKEPNFLSPDILDARGEAGAAQSLGDYLARLCPSAAAGRLTGEATPKYLYSEAAFDSLQRHADRVRLIVLLRNPVDLAAAMHGQNLRMGREREPDFARAWARGPARPGDRLTDYRFWGRPGLHLQRYLDRFPPERIRVLVLEEEMSRDPAAAHAGVLAFLGLAPQRLDSYEIRNPALAGRLPWLQGASRRLRRRTLALLAGLGLELRGSGVMRALDWLNGTRPDRRDLPAAVRAQVAAELAEDARLTARLLGRDSLPWPDFGWPAPTPAATPEGGR